MEYIKSKEFRSKFNKLTNNTKVNEKLRDYTTAMLEHRKGTDGEDLYVIDGEGNLLLRKIQGTNQLAVEVSVKEINSLRNHKGDVYGIHNHPTNIPPTGSDFVSCGARGYNKGFVVTHSGELYMYKNGKKAFKAFSLDRRIDKYLSEGYNGDEALERAIKDMGEEYDDILWMKIK